MTVFNGCGRDVSAIDFMTEFAEEYPLEGKIYCSSAKRSEEGYMSDEIFRKIYSYEGEIPKDFAVFLNSRPERGAECGIFRVDNGGTGIIEEFCLKRIKLISEGKNCGIVLTSGKYIFYSTLDDHEHAKEIFYRLIK